VRNRLFFVVYKFVFVVGLLCWVLVDIGGMVFYGVVIFICSSAKCLS